MPLCTDFYAIKLWKLDDLFGGNHRQSIWLLLRIRLVMRIGQDFACREDQDLPVSSAHTFGNANWSRIYLPALRIRICLPLSSPSPFAKRAFFLLRVFYLVYFFCLVFDYTSRSLATLVRLHRAWRPFNLHHNLGVLLFGFDRLLLRLCSWRDRAGALCDGQMVGL